MENLIDLPRALLRGRYMKAAAQIEHLGIPIDATALYILRQHWKAIQGELIQEIDSNFQVFEGRTFKMDRFRDYLIRNNISWPLLPSGALDMSEMPLKGWHGSIPR